MRGSRYKYQVAAVLLLLSTIISGCLFKGQPFRGVVSYRDGRVYLRPSRYYAQERYYYHVGMLPRGWERMDSGARTISWYSPEYLCSISTDAYCGRSVDNRSLASLGGEVITALSDRRVSDEREFELAGRGAVRKTVKGRVDGVPVEVDLVVVRKDACVFDFYMVCPGRPPEQALFDFEIFFGGFDY